MPPPKQRSRTSRSSRPMSMRAASSTVSVSPLASRSTQSRTRRTVWSAYAATRGPRAAAGTRRPRPRAAPASRRRGGRRPARSNPPAPTGWRAPGGPPASSPRPRALGSSSRSRNGVPPAGSTPPRHRYDVHRPVETRSASATPIPRASHASSTARAATSAAGAPPRCTRRRRRRARRRAAGGRPRSRPVPARQWGRAGPAARSLRPAAASRAARSPQGSRSARSRRGRARLRTRRWVSEAAGSARRSDPGRARGRTDVMLQVRRRGRRPGAAPICGKPARFRGMWTVTRLAIGRTGRTGSLVVPSPVRPASGRRLPPSGPVRSRGTAARHDRVRRQRPGHC